MKPLQTIALERAQIHAFIRSFFAERGYIEVDTPLLVASPDVSPNLTPFETTVIEPDGKQHPAGLITSPEFSMKKLLGKGMQKIFTITKVFRNGEELGGTHQPEFSMLEWYCQGADYQAMMTETELLVTGAAKLFGRSLPPFLRLRIRDAFLEGVGVDLDTASTSDLFQACERFGLRPDKGDTASDLFYRLLLSKIEPAFPKEPFFFYDYPAFQAALARLTPDKKYGERVEMYVDGLELSNGFTELTDASEQRTRFASELAERRQLQKTTFPIDESLLALLPSIQSPTYGNALGIDRLHMVCKQTQQIRDVVLFEATDLFY